MVFRISVNKPKILSAKVWRAILRRGFLKLGKFLYREMFPRKFTTGAWSEYHYAPRTKRYMIVKGAYKQHQDPLVWSGDTKRAVMSVRDIRETSRSATIVLRGLPPYIKQIPKPMSPHMEAELTKISRDDRDKGVAFLDRQLTREIQKEQNAAQGVMSVRS